MFVSDFDHPIREFVVSWQERISHLMTPLDAIVRILELGASLSLEDLPRVERLHIVKTATQGELTGMFAHMLPRTVTLNGALMVESDVSLLSQFSSLQDIVAHRIDFPKLILTQLKELFCIRSIAMSHTRLTDADMGILRNHPEIKSIHFAGTKLTDSALKIFGSLPALELLGLRGTLVTDAGLLQLQRLTNLLTIDVRETGVTMAGAAHYRQAVAQVLPDVEVLI